MVADFVAIDFETANAKRCSPCALGIAVVENGKVTTKRNWIIKPHKEYLWFDAINSMIHGMIEFDIEKAPEFPDIWPEIFPYLNKQTIIAHNASFDLSVLRRTIELYQIEYPDLGFYCTQLVSKALWPNLSSYRLDLLASFLEIPLQHHNPLDDANCAAEIVIRACQLRKTHSLDRLASDLGITNGKLCPSGYTPCSAPGINSQRSCGCRNDRLRKLANDTAINPDARPNHPLYAKKVVFTGTLMSMTREKAMQAVLDVGGDPDMRITRGTNYLVVGIQDLQRLKDGKKSSKMKQAERFAAEGYPIEIIDESDFLTMLNGEDDYEQEGFGSPA